MVVVSGLYQPYIPEKIEVHLGKAEEEGENIEIPFSDYIKYVSSKVIYPTWPESVIRANIYAINNFVLNRIATKWYRTQGYDFDITSDGELDLPFKKDGNSYDNVIRMADELFNSYMVRRGTLEPIYTPICTEYENEGCEGLSQWGAIELAQKGYRPYEILEYYYGDDIDIITEAPVMANYESYPLYTLKMGSFGRYVSILQNELNRIAMNYPTIPMIEDEEKGIFGSQTEAAVKKFQQIFNLDVDGLVGNATWYKLKRIYNEVKGLNDITTEGVLPSELEGPFDSEWQEGDTGIWVKTIQYYIKALSCYFTEIPSVEITGEFGPETTNAVKKLQEYFEVKSNGAVGVETWIVLDREYRAILDKIPEGCFQNNILYPGYPLFKGMADKNIRLLQTYLQKIADVYSTIPEMEINGMFDDDMVETVRAFQTEFGKDITGVVGPITWSSIVGVYEKLQNNNLTP